MRLLVGDRGVLVRGYEGRTTGVVLAKGSVKDLIAKSRLVKRDPKRSISCARARAPRLHKLKKV